MLPREEALKAIIDVGIVAIIRLDSPLHFQAIAGALQDGGIRAMEFTMTNPNALEMLKEADKNLNKNTILGAGIVLDPETARAVILAGAKFIVAPNLNLDVIATARRYSVAVIPGAFTPSEIISAW